MKQHSSKQTVFTNYFFWTCRRQFSQLWRKSFAANLTICPSKSKNYPQNVLKKVFIPAFYPLDKLTSVLTTPGEKIDSLWKSFDQTISNNSTFFQNFHPSKAPLDMKHSALTSLMQKVCRKLSFFARSPKIVLKREFFKINFFWKKILSTRRMKYSLDKAVENCSQ